MPDFFSSAQSFWPVYMIVADGSLLSNVLQISKKKKRSFIVAIAFFMLKEGEIQKEREVPRRHVCTSEKNGKTPTLTFIKGKGIMY